MSSPLPASGPTAAASSRRVQEGSAPKDQSLPHFVANPPKHAFSSAHFGFSAASESPTTDTRSKYPQTSAHPQEDIFAPANAHFEEPKPSAFSNGTQPLQRKLPESDMSLDTLLRLREMMKSRRRTLHSDLRRIKDTIRLKREVQIPDPSLRTSASQRAADSDRGTSTTSTFSLGSQRQAPSQLTRRARNRIAPTAPQRILAQDIALPAM